jgi:beta-glucosidase
MQPVVGGTHTQNRTPENGGPIVVENIEGAFQMWQRAYELGNLDIDARTRWEQAGTRILQMFIAPGLYENPFLSLENSLAVVGAPEKQAAGFEAQLASVVMLANDGTVSESTLADWAEMTVYVPASFDNGHPGFGPASQTHGATLDLDIVGHFFGTVLTDEIVLDADGRVVEFIAPSAEELATVDIVIVGMDSPNNGSQFSQSGFNAAEGEWRPLSLQWAPYTADGDYVRTTSISGRPLEDGTRENRSYFGATSAISNEEHLGSFQRAAAIAAELDVPVITLVRGVGPSTFVPTEIYGDSSAILLGFGISDQALLEVALGLREPSGRLPMTMPADMDAVERQLEDIADTDPFIDGDGNAWGFGFGLNWSGVIR